MTILSFVSTSLIALCLFAVLLYLVLRVVIFCLALRPVQTAQPPSDHVVVTGGSSGIGLEVARLYLKAGFKVSILARNQQRLDDACRELTKDPLPDSARVQALSCDVGTSEEVVALCLAKAVEAFGPVDILINCAGTSIAAEFSDLPAEAFERMLRINVLGSVYPTRAVVPAMKSRGRGHIVFVSSQVAQAALHGYTAYAASKWALRGLAEALLAELRPYNVHVSVAYPPDTRTPGYAEEMLTKPRITSLLSESGTPLEATEVARDIVDATRSSNPVYTIASGLDGHLLKQLHAGMTPVTNAWEVVQQVLVASPGRLIALFYVLYWQILIRKHTTTPAAPREGAKEKKA